MMPSVPPSVVPVAGTSRIPAVCSPAFHPLARYVVALALVAIATAGALALRRRLSIDPQMLFLLAAALAAWLGGTWPGLLAVAAAAIAQGYWFFPPHEALTATAPRSMIQLGIWTAAVATTSVLIGLLSTSRRHCRTGTADTEARVKEIEGVLFGLVARDFRRRVTVRGDGSALDAVAGSVNTVAEELATSADVSLGNKQELRAKTALLEAVLDGIADEVIVIDDTGKLVLVNRAARLVTGRTYETVEEWARAHDVLLPDRVTRFPPGDDPIGRVLRGAPGAEAEMFIRRAGAPTGRFVRTTARPWSLHDGHSGVVIVCNDISAHQMYTIEQERARAAAEAATRAKSEFLANMSHELRTPLNGIMGFAELLAGSPLDDEQRQYITLLQGSAESLCDVIGDVLDFSKIEAGRMALEQRPFTLRATCDAALAPLALAARSKGLDLRLRVHDEAPDALTGDVLRFRQVLVNLVGNAVKFTARGEVAIEVSAAPHRSHGVELHVVVRDTGPGIPAGLHRAIFQPFTQADGSTTRKFGGTGLGLAISAELVALMGGKIWVESVVGSGATFHFTARIDVTAPAQGAAREPASPAKVGAMRVLLAEDNAPNRFAATRLLEQNGHVVTTASSGREVLDALEKDTFDMILMDVQMPGMSGVVATRAIREREAATGRHVPIIAVTAHALKDDEELFLAAGMDGYIAKPLRPRALLALMDKLAQTPRGHGEAANHAASPQSDERAPLSRRAPPSRRAYRVDNNPDPGGERETTTTA